LRLNSLNGDLQRYVAEIRKNKRLQDDQKEECDKKHIEVSELENQRKQTQQILLELQQKIDTLEEHDKFMAQDKEELNRLFDTKEKSFSF